MRNQLLRIIIAPVAVALLFSGCSPANNSSHTASISPQPEPSIVVSGVDDYWQTAAALSGSAETIITVDTSQKYQSWHGLGGTFNEAGWQALLQLPESDRTAIMRLLFDKQNGIGFEWGRIPMGASDFALTRYTLNDVPGDTDMSQFSLARDREFLIPYVKAAQAVKDDIKFWGSPWTPPAWMKTNNAFDRGAFDPQYFQAYAQYFVAWVQAYQSEGVAIDHVQPQNEPGWSQDYPSCAWGPSIYNGEFKDRDVTLATFTEQYLAPALAHHVPDTDLWYGTLSNGQTFDTYWKAVSEAGRRQLTGVGLQWGTHSRVAELAATEGKAGKPLLVMQTEHMCGNYPWLNKMATSRADANRENFLSTEAPNNHAYGEESWELIKRWVEQGVHIYSAWNMVLDTGGFNLDEARPWPQNALIAVDRDKHTYEVTPAYYVFRHIGQFVAPGATRVAISGNALAFKNPDDSLVAIIYNELAEASTTKLIAGNKSVTVKIPPQGWTTVHW